MTDFFSNVLALTLTPCCLIGTLFLVPILCYNCSIPTIDSLIGVLVILFQMGISLWFLFSKIREIFFPFTKFIFAVHYILLTAILAIPTIRLLPFHVGESIGLPIFTLYMFVNLMVIIKSFLRSKTKTS